MIWVLQITALVAFFIAALAGRPVVEALRRLKFGQTIREDGPTWHKGKQGTPTMGGVLFVGSTVLTLILVIIVCEWALPYKVFSATPASLTTLVAGWIMALACGAIGFIDDYIKIVKKRNLGLTSRQKLVLQLLVGGGYGASVWMAGATEVDVPFFGVVDFGVWYIPFAVFVITAMTNAVNLTDGVDGLCGSVSTIVSLFFLATSGMFYGQGLTAAALAGALIGFLVWNIHPARVFMGDTGALFIGGMLSSFALASGKPFILLAVGIVYILEVLSDIIQVVYFKLTHGKRLFKMAPIHHHLEMCGWSENVIVIVFSLITLIGCAVAWLIF